MLSPKTHSKRLFIFSLVVCQRGAEAGGNDLPFPGDMKPLTSILSDWLTSGHWTKAWRGKPRSERDLFPAQMGGEGGRPITTCLVHVLHLVNRNPNRGNGLPRHCVSPAGHSPARCVLVCLRKCLSCVSKF